MRCVWTRKVITSAGTMMMTAMAHMGRAACPRDVAMTRFLRTRREALVPVLLLLPAVLTMLFVVALPLLFSLWTSLTPSPFWTD